MLLLLFFHWPFLFTKWNLETETKILSAFALLAVVWDFLWFVINPYFGLENYNNANIWWFSNWLIGFPTDYLFGLVMAIFIRSIPGLLKNQNFRTYFIDGVMFVFCSVLGVFIFTLLYSVITG